MDRNQIDQLLMVYGSKIPANMYPMVKSRLETMDSNTANVAFMHARLPLEAHGTGCTLASAIAANLCLGLSMPKAAREASDYVERALRLGTRPGRGDIVVLDHSGAAPPERR